jgi:hypothetical protein
MKKWRRKEKNHMLTNPLTREQHIFNIEPSNRTQSL